MDIDFENWLKQNDLYEYYQTHPESQDSIFKDYQYESVGADIEEWVAWSVNNTELAKQLYPDVMNSMEERISNKPVYFTANVIQKIPEYFLQWREAAQKLTGSTKEKAIAQYITLLQLVKSEKHNPSIVIQEAVKTIRPELLEELLYWLKELKKYRAEKKVQLEHSKPKRTKEELLTDKLNKYNFLDLPKVKALNQSSQDQLIKLISSQNTPYQIAIFNYLDFIKHLLEEHFKTKKKLYKGIAQILNSQERTIKGNILVLNSKSKENRQRYTAHIHKEQVEKEYHQLK